MREAALCACGCGHPAPIAKKTNRRKGHVEGQPTQWVSGHNGHGQPSRPVPERFWEKVDRSAGLEACWPWTGAKNPDGYGQISVAGRMVGAHVVSWEIAHPDQPIPPGVEVCHTCDNPPCVNHAHLFLDDHAGNMHDMARKGRHRPGVRPRGEQHSMAKLTAAQVLEIRRLYASGGVTMAALAHRLSVSRATVRLVVVGRTWKHLEELT